MTDWSRKEFSIERNKCNDMIIEQKYWNGNIKCDFLNENEVNELNLTENKIMEILKVLDLSQWRLCITVFYLMPQMLSFNVIITTVIKFPLQFENRGGKSNCTELISQVVPCQ